VNVNFYFKTFDPHRLADALHQNATPVIVVVAGLTQKFALHEAEPFCKLLQENKSLNPKLRDNFVQLKNGTCSRRKSQANRSL
jgi:hypothetical protein